MVVRGVAEPGLETVRRVLEDIVEASPCRTPRGFDSTFRAGVASGDRLMGRALANPPGCARPRGGGMGGTGGSFGWWSEAGGYALGSVTGHGADHDRGDRVENAVRAVLGVAPVWRPPERAMARAGAGT